MGRREAAADLRMSKRGRRRSSRRKSSTSSKQSVTPYIFQKQNKSNSVTYKDDTVEKGEADSLRKENVESGSEDEEKYNDAPPREKRFKQDSNINASPSNQGNFYTVTREDQDKGVKIVTSVSVDDLEDSFPKIVFQQSQAPLCPNLPLRPVTNVLEINCSRSQVKLEIQEILPDSTSGFRTTVVFRHDRGDDKCGGSWRPDNELHEHGSVHTTGDRAHHTGPRGHGLSLGGPNQQSVVICDDSKSNAARRWSHVDCCQCCNNHRQLTPVTVMLRGPSSSPPSSPLSSPPSRPPSRALSSPPLLGANIGSQGKRKHLCRSLSSDHFWDIPPPQQFADGKFNTLDDLVRDLASCRIDAGCYGDTEQWEFHPAHDLACDEAKERPNLGPWYEPFSECENYELMLMRPSLSTNRSSFTKEFVNGQKRRSWIRNNSIATVERRSCSLPRKRRQTFPGMSQASMQEEVTLPFSESFYSLIVNSLPLRSERRGRLGPDATAAEPVTADGPRRSRLSSCEDNSEDVFAAGRRFHRLSSTTVQLGHPAQELLCRPPPDLNAEHQVDQSEVADSGFEQEMGEVECRSPEPLAGARRHRALAIQITPPSCSGSEEHLLQPQPDASFHSGQEVHAGQQDSLSGLPKQSKSSVMTMTVGSPEQRFLQTDSCVSSTEPTAASNICEAKMDLDLSPSVEEPGGSGGGGDGGDGGGGDGGGNGGSGGSSSMATTSQETNQRPNSCEDKSIPSCSVKGSIESDVHSKRSSIKGDKTDRLLASRDAKEHLKPVALKDQDGGGSDGWAKRRKLFKETREWSSAGGSSITSDITEESVSEDTRSIDMSVGDSEDRGFYTETFHSASWIYQGDDVDSGAIPPSLNTRTRAVSIRERTVRISKGAGEYPWGFRIQFSKPIVVTEVDTNGAAEEAGLMVGDYVLAVNGTDVTSIPHSEAADLARQGPDILTLTIGSDIARGPNTPRPACRGYLHKRTQSGLIKGWRKRWFVLTHDCCLYYYRHKRDEGKRRALAAVKLEGAEVGPDASLGKPFVLKCRPLSASRVYYFCATSNQEMKRWIEAIERAVHPITQNHVWVDVTRHNSGLPPLAVKSPECLGLLHKMDRAKDSWIQHYCILKDGCLYLYSGIRATHAHGGIYLQGYLVREQPYGSKKSTIELKPPSDEFKTFYLCAENPNENKRWIVALKASVKKWLPLHQALRDYMNRPPEETRM